MGFVKVLLLLIEMIASVLLVAVILVQKTKDEGLGLAFGAMMGETLFGSRAGNVLTKITITLAVIFLIDTALLAVIYSRSGGGGSSSLVDRVTPRTSPSRSGAPAAAPQGPAAPGVSEEVPVPPASETPAPAASAPVGNGGAASVPVAPPVAPVPVPAK